MLTQNNNSSIREQLFAYIRVLYVDES